MEVEKRELKVKQGMHNETFTVTSSSASNTRIVYFYKAADSGWQSAGAHLFAVIQVSLQGQTQTASLILSLSGSENSSTSYPVTKTGQFNLFLDSPMATNE